MSNNRDVDYDGDTYFFTTEEADSVAHIKSRPQVGLSYAGSEGLFGKRPVFIAVQGEAELIHERERFAERWNSDLERWFAQGVDTPGLVLLKVHARRIHYWDGTDEGEIVLG